MSRGYKKFFQMITNMNYGNWSDAARIGVDNGFDGYSLLEFNDGAREAGGLTMSERDLVIITMYIERMRLNGNKN